MSESPDILSARQLDANSRLARYSRQILFPKIGRDGQDRLLRSSVVLVGCGALGTVLADILVRAGVGKLRLVDRDYVEPSNLQRQVLFTEKDAAEGAPKAVAAAEHLARVNSEIAVEPIIADVTPDNIEKFIDSAQLILDGTDNFETRFLINDAAVKHKLPWVYGACVGGEGMVLPVFPGETPCLRCIWEQPPPPGMSATCDTAGVLASIVHVVAALEAAEALKILIGRREEVSRKLVQIQVWEGRWEAFDVQNAFQPGACVCCGKGQFEYLEGKLGGRNATLCGRDAVQVSGATKGEVPFEALAARLAPLAKSPPRFNRYLLRAEVEGVCITLFRDGRAIIKGTSEPDVARSIYARYIGS